MPDRRKPLEIQERSFLFACRIIEVVEQLGTRTPVARMIGRQVLRSGTSVGANLEEASGAQSKADFVSKCSIALKEARETKYWLRLLAVAKTPVSGRLVSIIAEADEIVAILTTIAKKAAQSPNRTSGAATLNIQH